MTVRRTLTVLILATGLSIVAYFVSMIAIDRANPEVQAEKALLVLRPRVQEFADHVGRVPRSLDELPGPAIVDALRSQIRRSQFDLLWLRRDDGYGVLVARRRTAADVAPAYVALITAPHTAPVHP